MINNHYVYKTSEYYRASNEQGTHDKQQLVVKAIPKETRVVGVQSRNEAPGNLETAYRIKLRGCYTVPLMPVIPVCVRPRSFVHHNGC